MEVKVVYEDGVFKPLQEITWIKEGMQMEINLEIEEFHNLLSIGGSFDFLNDEEELYSEKDIVEKIIISKEEKKSL